MSLFRGLFSYLYLQRVAKRRSLRHLTPCKSLAPAIQDDCAQETQLQMRLIPPPLFTRMALSAFILCSPGCALYNDMIPLGALITTCSIPADQSGTIQGIWPLKPIPVAFAQGQFSSAELAQMVAALDSWNRFYSLSKKFEIFDYGGNPNSPRIDSTPNPAALGGSICTLKLVNPNNPQAFMGNVVIYKETAWPVAYSTSFIALTTYCVTNSSPYSKMNMAIMEFNYQNFFTPGTPQPDLQSVMLHELGHLSGLDHSCHPTGQAGFPTCSAGVAPEYLTAVMFPAFTFDPYTAMGQQKRVLGINDQSRSNCLY